MCFKCEIMFRNSRNNICESPNFDQLIRTKHEEVKLSETGHVRETTIECRSCGFRNSLVLGFVPFKSCSSVVVVLVRPPSPSSVDPTNAEDWDDDESTTSYQQWSTLDDDCCFLSCMVNVPAEKEQICQLQQQSSKNKEKRYRYRAKNQKFLHVDVKQEPLCTIVQKNVNKEIDTIKDNKLEFHKQEFKKLRRPYSLDYNMEPQSALLRYSSAAQYQSIFSPLIKCEAEYDKHLKESQSQDNISIRWKVLLNKKIIAYFTLCKSDGAFRLTLGDRLRLKYAGEGKKPWMTFCRVIKVPDNWNDETGVELLKTHSYIPFECTTNFTVECVWRSTGFDRMQVSLKKFAEDETSVSTYIHNRILGLPTEEVLFSWFDLELYSVPNLPELNPSQATAVKHAMQRPLSLIQGPPGTGKTLVSLSIVYQLVKNNHAKVLVCAPSNIAVDQLAENLHKTKLKVVRLSAELRESIDSSAAFLTLNNQIRNSETNVELEKLHYQYDHGQLSVDEERRYLTLKMAAERNVLDEADVICCTCIGAGDHRLARMKFQAILIDEAMQATEPECMIPAILGCNQLILVGDQCQLGPIVKFSLAARAGLSMSLFERLVKIGFGTSLLDIQYRMHPEISNFPSKYFYEGFLRDGILSENRRLPDDVFPWPDPRLPMLFYVVQGIEETSGISFMNSAEAFIVEKMVTQFLKNGIGPERIGVITPYEGQRAHLVQCLQFRGALHARVYQQIEIAKVDAFQGREKDIIIMSCVRSNENGDIGFLKDPRRLNVALTRAKYGLIIIGNPKALSRQSIWHNLLNFYKQKNILVEGPISNLTASTIHFGRSRK